MKLSYSLTLNRKDSPYICILTHGSCTDKDELFLPYLAENLSYNTLRFDHQGNGESEGEFTAGGFHRDVEDIRDVVGWAKDNGYKPLALIGHSKGGNNVLLYDAKYGDIPLVVPISARFDMSVRPSIFNSVAAEVAEKGAGVLALGSREYLITQEALQERENLPTAKICSSASNWVCVVHGDSDSMPSKEDFYHICSLLKLQCFESHLVPNAGHMFTGCENALIEIIEDFIEKALPLLLLTNRI